ncbi:protein MpKAOL2 [Marchantia polymorpha subsp. ruderalis]|uniref:Cytochrome P450 n=2 Tax=Marchantia polymorpha TaxID=3197 RepID=A0AAF6AU63_MARPO|nr:hypothetical protein MARPO_0002s0331 [Marchantia polymorpha]BBM99983.1 hypothetical protein Mp_1g25410 [Marchantia polymorpha subsp. ruderalis]|eukprot:PTQ49896.1 hypothetical protein MARPO_0002s0331 [Marchantia polymorpha]
MASYSTAIAVSAVLGAATVLLLCTRDFLSYWLYVRPLKLNATGSKLPPGSLGWPFFGEMRDFLKCFKNQKPDLFVQAREDRYGKAGLYTTSMFGVPSIMATKTETLRFLLKRDDVFGPGWPSMSAIMGKHSVVSVTGELHKSLRRYLFDAISSPQGMRLAIPHLDASMRSNLKQWADQGSINIRECTRNLTFYNIVDNFLSMKPSPEVDAIQRDYGMYMDGIRAIPVYLPGTAHYRAANSRRRLKGRFQEIIDTRRAANVHHNDFLQSLMDARSADGEPLTDEQLTDNLISLMLAGYESSAYSMMWVLILLAKHPECLAKLRAEHNHIKERIGESQLSLEDTNSMKYTHKVIDETLRLVNVAPMVFRTVLQDVTYKGYLIPKGWKVMPWLRAPHMDPDCFPEPERFNPDRWDAKDVNHEAFNPFGGGIRTCVGNQFARLQVSMFLHHLSLGYRWELLNPDAKVDHLPHPRPSDGGPMVFSTL